MNTIKEEIEFVRSLEKDHKPSAPISVKMGLLSNLANAVEGTNSHYEALKEYVANGSQSHTHNPPLEVAIKIPPVADDGVFDGYAQAALISLTGAVMTSKDKVRAAMAMATDAMLQRNQAMKEVKEKTASKRNET